MRRLDVLTLRCVLAVQRTGSIASAADQVGLAASAVSKRLSDLEEEIGHPIFDRSNRGVAPTPVGEAVIERARRIVELTDGFTADLGDFAEGTRGEVRLSVVSAALAGRLADDLSSFEKDHPRVHVTLMERSHREAVRMVADGLCDLSVSVDHQLPGDMVRHDYADDPVWVIGPLGHPLFKGRGKDEKVRFAETLDHDIIAMAGGASIEAMILNAAAMIDHPIRKHFEVTRHDSLRRLVEVGLGVGFIRESGVTRFTTVYEIEGRPLADEWASRRLCVLRRKSALLGGAAKALESHLIEAAAARGRAPLPPRS
ncbi:LysR family transcriptional regulator [Afifella sp. IM 167]|uniref:LysR family transcriptional regulator n=1 Tax=Afifella sp. IM 167 TaxID=2033586 RepID=UPI001CCF99BE|nr:LysR family transcriptional regulator [Afifella sp. IM 167]MBZ8131977.1 LysR family transcriptional regulator [Afifella sp. IM 167]